MKYIICILIVKVEYCVFVPVSFIDFTFKNGILMQATGPVKYLCQ